MKFMAKVCAEFFERHKPPSTIAKPACMNMTKKPVTSVHTMLMENMLWALRSYRSGIVKLLATHRRSIFRWRQPNMQD